MKIRYSNKAKRDLLDIWDFIANDNAQEADKFILKITNKINQLKDHPHSGVSRKDIAKGVKHLVCGNYLALYQINQNDVEIIRCIHGSRKLSDLSL